jgi:small subunit ribosomal protein S16
MAVKMRLRREGKKKQPHYRIIVTDSRSPRDGRFLEDLGYYHPLSEPSSISLDHDRALHWLRHGAQPTEAVQNLLRIEGVWESWRPGEAEAQAERRERRAQRRAQKEKAATSGAASARESNAAAESEPAGEAASAGEDEAVSEPGAEAADAQESQP